MKTPRLWRGKKESRAISDRAQNLCPKCGLATLCSIAYQVASEPTSPLPSPLPGHNMNCLLFPVKHFLHERYISDHRENIPQRVK